MSRPGVELTFEELAAWLRDRSATMSWAAQGPTFHVRASVPPIIGPVVVENPDFELAVRGAMRLIDCAVEARAQAAEVSGA